MLQRDEKKTRWFIVARSILFFCLQRVQLLLHMLIYQKTVVAETLGGWNKVAVEEIKKLPTAKARHAGGEEEEQIRRAFTKLSVLLMRGNAEILANSNPDENVRVRE